MNTHGQEQHAILQIVRFGQQQSGSLRVMPGEPFAGSQPEPAKGIFLGSRLYLGGDRS